jgi:uncharacterized protein (TIGR02246 family)
MWRRSAIEIFHRDDEHGSVKLFDSNPATPGPESGMTHHIPSSGAAGDLAALVALNDDYIDAVRTSNVSRFSEILADDFLCTLADGSLIDRAQFLANAAAPTTALGLQVHDVRVRLLGDDVAIVHAATAFTHPDGRPGRGRYTDVWARRNGQWVAVAAQFARL